MVGDRKHPDHGASHRVDDSHGRVAREDAPSRLRQRGRRKHGDTNHARELHLDAEVQHHEEHEKGGELRRVLGECIYMGDVGRRLLQGWAQQKIQFSSFASFPTFLSV